MSETWKQWEGRTVDGRFPLQSYLGGSDHSAVFLTLMQSAADGSGQAAIKLISAGGDDAEKQLLRWQAARELNHPNLIRILEAGRCQLDSTDLLYVVEEYAEENLSQILPERALTAEEVRALLPPVLQALQFVHEKGFVHGHVQPSNILAVGDQVKLSSDDLDVPGERSRRAGAVSPYDPPEAATGAASTAADVWQLGMTLVEVLTQRVPVWDVARASAAGDTTRGPGAISPDRGTLLADGCRKALDDCGDQRSAVTSEGRIGTAGASSDASDCGSTERIGEMALLAGAGGVGCGCDLSDCETENTRPADGNAIDASDAGGGGRKRAVHH